MIKKRITLLKYIGLLPITIVGDKSVTKPSNVVVFVTSVSFGIFMIYSYFIHRKEFFTSKSEIANLGNFIAFVASIAVSITNMVVSFIFRHRIWNILLKTAISDEKVSMK